MSQCSVTNCSLDVHEADKCILHCEKHKYQTDWHNMGFLNSFYDELLNYIVAVKRTTKR